MKKPIVLFLFAFLACKPSQKQEKTDETVSVIDAVKENDEPITEVRTFVALEGTYGYEIWIDGTKTIYQASIPGLPGNEGFSSEEKAKKAGEFVAVKIRKNQMPPTVTPEELDSLGVLQ
jgi:hypothetical protein